MAPDGSTWSDDSSVCGALDKVIPDEFDRIRLQRMLNSLGLPWVTLTVYLDVHPTGAETVLHAFTFIDRAPSRRWIDMIEATLASIGGRPSKANVVRHQRVVGLLASVRR